MRLDHYIFSIILIGIACHTNAQEVMTLEKAISIGIEENFQIRIDEANILIADNNDSWARAGKGPTVDLNANLSPTLVNDNNPASFLNGVYFASGLGASIDVSWTLFAGGRVAITKNQFQTITEQQRLVKETGINNLIRDIYQSYQNVLLQQERLRVLEESAELSNNRLEYEQVKKEFGASNSFNISQFEEAIISDSINIINQIDLIHSTKRTLYSVLSIPADQDYKFNGALSVDLEEVDERKLKSLLSEANYTLRTLKIIQDLSVLNSQLAEAAKRPLVNVSTSIGVSENYFKFFKDNPNTGEPFAGAFSNRINLGAGVNLNYNLYDGGIRNKDIENAKIQEDIAQLDILNATVELNNQIDILIGNYNSQKQVLLMNERQIDVVARNLIMAEERYKAGNISSVDYRAIQNQFLNAAFTKTNSIYNLLITKSEIDWLAGVYGHSM